MREGRESREPRGACWMVMTKSCLTLSSAWHFPESLILWDPPPLPSTPSSSPCQRAYQSCRLPHVKVPAACGWLYYIYCCEPVEKGGEGAPSDVTPGHILICYITARWKSYMRWVALYWRMPLRVNYRRCAGGEFINKKIKFHWKHSLKSLENQNGVSLNRSGVKWKG